MKNINLFLFFAEIAMSEFTERWYVCFSGNLHRMVTAKSADNCKLMGMQVL